MGRISIVSDASLTLELSVNRPLRLVHSERLRQHHRNAAGKRYGDGDGGARCE